MNSNDDFSGNQLGKYQLKTETIKVARLELCSWRRVQKLDSISRSRFINVLLINIALYLHCKCKIDNLI